MADASWGQAISHMSIAAMAYVGVLAVTAFVGTWLARHYALRRRLLDEPGDRRSHVTATPRGGGISIVVAMLAAIALLAWRTPASATLLYSIGGGLCLVAGVGWVDDHRPLSPLLRLVVQGLAALLLGWAVADAGAGIAAAIAAIVLAMVLVNVWNFMDGINGLAASQALLVALGYALLPHAGVAAWLALALAAACAGFLPFNAPRARVFLGDVGSGALGYLLAAIVALTVFVQPDWVRAPVVLLPLSAFLIDSSLTLLKRMADRQRWWLPHTEHAYQHWARRLQRHGPVTAAYAGWTLVMVLAMLLANTQGLAVTMAWLAITGVAGLAAWSALRGAATKDRTR
jgi:UDP-N-acetylmuramyl pentapeptide phosphotransferase/UDP-N-acetylglucosamine-1-phosphate transferase